MTLAKKLIVVALPLTLAIAGCETMGEQDQAMTEKASMSQSDSKAAMAAEKAAAEAAAAARSAEQAARAAEAAAAEARAAGDKADRAFRSGLRK